MNVTKTQPLIAAMSKKQLFKQLNALNDKTIRFATNRVISLNRNIAYEDAGKLKTVRRNEVALVLFTFGEISKQTLIEVDSSLYEFYCDIIGG
jgi:hypothetical protein